MTHTLPKVGHELHERLLQTVDELPEIGDRLLAAKGVELRPEVDQISAFLTGTLVPHMDAAEQNLYPELERMYQNRHSMTPMRREHVEIRRLVGEFARLTDQLDVGHVGIGRTFALRRVLFQLYALIKIHLAEEEVYLRIVDHGVAADASDLLAAALEHPGFRSA